MKYIEELPSAPPVSRSSRVSLGPGAPEARRWLKRMCRRARRRFERHDPESVPTKFTKGWYW